MNHQFPGEAFGGWFSEGFDTPDLREVRALLAELSANAQVQRQKLLGVTAT